jgi:hypothetical protein
MKTLKVVIELELESVDKESVYSYLRELMDDESLDFDVKEVSKTDMRHPIADL